MKNVLLLLFAFVIVFGAFGNSSEEAVSVDQDIADLVEQLSRTFTREDLTTIAITDFATLEDKPTMLGRYLREELTVRLYQKGSFTIVERAMLDEVMQEADLAMKGVLSEESAVRIGQILGVQAVVIGSLTDLGSSIKVNARIISVETAAVVSVASVLLAKDDTVNALMGQELSTPDQRPAGEAVPEAKPENSDGPSGDAAIVFESAGVLFGLTKAVFNGADRILTISGYVTAADYDIELRFSGKYCDVNVVDSFGNTHELVKATVGNQTHTGYGPPRTIELLAGVRTNLDLEYEVTSGAPEAVLLFFMDDHNWRTTAGNLELKERIELDVTED